jgi:hypothetical protein
MLQDMAVLTGGDVISEETGLSLEKAKLENLGQASRVIIDKSTTTIIGGKGFKSKIDSRVVEIKKQIELSEGGDDKKKLEERLAKLTGGVAVIRVGAATEVEVKEKKDRIDDALNATKAAVEDGIVPGGGVAYLRAKQNIADLKGHNEDQTAGVQIVLKAIESPVRQIVANAGGSSLCPFKSAIFCLALRYATPPPGTMPSSTAALVAFKASSILSFFSFTSTSVAAPTLITATPPVNLANLSSNFFLSSPPSLNSICFLISTTLLSILDLNPLPPMIVVVLLSMITLDACPRFSSLAFSKLKPVSSDITSPPVNTAISCSIAFLLLP